MLSGTKPSTKLAIHWTSGWTVRSDRQTDWQDWAGQKYKQCRQCQDNTTHQSFFDVLQSSLDCWSSMWSSDLVISLLTTLNWSGNVSDLLLSQQFYSFIKLKLTVCSGKCPEWVDVVLTRLKGKHSHNWLQSPPLSSILQTKMYLLHCL